jgi:hypothetical protein
MTDRAGRPERPAGWGIPLGVGAGAGIGMVLGILFDQLVMGLIFGAAIGLVVAASATGVAATPEARCGRVIAAAIGIALAGVAIILAILSR